MAAWAFECLLCKASQKSYLAPGKLGESEWEGRLAGSRTSSLTRGLMHLSDPSANGSWAWSGKEPSHRPLSAVGHLAGDCWRLFIPESEGSAANDVIEWHFVSGPCDLGSGVQLK